MTITAIKNHIVFQFNDPVNSKGEFEEAATEGGIYIHGNADKSAKTPRWATVTSVGDECEHVQPGDIILMPALRWTAGIKYEEKYYWRTDEKEVVGYRRGSDFVLINTYVLFQQEKTTMPRNETGLIVISQKPVSTPRGKVLLIGADNDPILNGAIIYFDIANFYDTTKLDSFEVSFIKEDNILAYEVPGE